MTGDAHQRSEANTQGIDGTHASGHHEHGHLNDLCVWVVIEFLGRCCVVCCLHLEAIALKLKPVKELRLWRDPKKKDVSHRSRGGGGSAREKHRDARHEQAQILYLQEEDEPDEKEISSGSKRDTETVGNGDAVIASGSVGNMTRSVVRKTVGEAGESGQQREAASEIVNSVVEVDPRNYREAMRSKTREKWQKLSRRNLVPLKKTKGERSCECPVTLTCITQMGKDAEVDIECWKARLLTCGNEQELDVDYNITFTAVIDMSSVKLILGLARKWGVPARYSDVPNAYADKEMGLVIYIRLPQGMKVADDIRKKLRVTIDKEVVLELKKALYSL
ncbi:Hypothetical protein PHPALM_5877 [Phytophthora palmivora]|uniref:Reverse transcriptase Ty1/copia-type domain-containing protein n=1 Tax=Phytophthora palmivora TaxID=4796 RepID=A0A2P4YG99_9STRA|nr:Hypothetical protein PHPALM_5877 [Phytophthora palmivora]